MINGIYRKFFFDGQTDSQTHRTCLEICDSVRLSLKTTFKTFGPPGVPGVAQKARCSEAVYKYLGRRL